MLILINLCVLVDWNHLLDITTYRSLIGNFVVKLFSYGDLIAAILSLDAMFS